MKRTLLSSFILLSATLTLLPMNNNNISEGKQEQEETSRVPSLKDQCAQAAARKLYNLCKQATPANVGEIQKCIEQELNKLPFELKDAVKELFAQKYGWETPLVEKDINLTEIFNLHPASFDTPIFIKTNNDLIALYPEEANIYIFDTATEKQYIIETDKPVLELCLAQNKAIVAYTTDNKIIHVYDIKKDEEVQKIELPEATPIKLALSPDARFLAAITISSQQNGSHVIKLWDVKTGKLLHELKDIFAFQFIPNSNNIAVIQYIDAYFNSIVIWDIIAKKSVAATNDYAERISFQVSPQGTYIAYILPGSRKVRVMNIEENIVKKYSVPSGSTLRTLTFSHDEKYLMIEDGEELPIIDLTNGKIIRTLQGPKTTLDDTECTYFYKDTMIINPYFFSLSLPLSFRELVDNILPEFDSFDSFINQQRKKAKPRPIMYIHDLNRENSLHEIAHISNVHTVLYVSGKIVIFYGDDTGNLKTHIITCHPQALALLPLVEAYNDVRDNNNEAANALGQEIETIYEQLDNNNQKSEE